MSLWRKLLGIKEPPKADTETRVKESPKVDTETQVKEPPKADTETQVKEPPEADTETQVKEPPEADTETQVKEPVEPSIEDEFKTANENLRRLGAPTITPVAGTSDYEKFLLILDAYLEATDKPVTVATDRSYLLSMQTALEHHEKISGRMDRVKETANSPSQSDKPEKAARSIEREYKIANGHLRSLGASPVQPPASGTERDRLMPILEAYTQVMLRPFAIEELARSRTGYR